jgi:hypothetical protein
MDSVRPFEIINRTSVIGYRDDYDSTVTMLEDAMNELWLEGLHDDEIGSVTEDGLHIFRVAQYTLETDSAGFTQLYQHDRIVQAHEYMESRFQVLMNFTG